MFKIWAHCCKIPRSSSSEQAYKFCSIKSLTNQDAETIFIPSGGRGRGILGEIQSWETMTIISTDYTINRHYAPQDLKLWLEAISSDQGKLRIHHYN